MPNTVTDLGSLGGVTLAGLLDMDSQRTLVLTVNNRHARRLLADLSGLLREDRRVMPLPAIVPLAAWYRQAADALSFLPQAHIPSHALDAFAAQGVWRQVIQAVEGEASLLDTSTAARLAYDADTLFDEWQLVVDPAAETPDYQRFQVWREAYKVRLAELDAEDVNASIGRVYAAVARGGLPSDIDTLVLAGFNELSPRLSALLSTLGGGGVQVLVLSSRQQIQGSLQRVAVADADPEWWAAARWARDCLCNDPKGRYAIVASRLETDVALAHRVLRQTLPAAERYNIAVARPLGQWPLARAALAWLTVLADFHRSGRSTPSVLGVALLAGACAGDREESAARARIDAVWRKRAVVSVSLPEFTAALADAAPRLHQAWLACADLLAGQPRRAGLHARAAGFRELLVQLGFPGGTSQGSAAFQTLEAFDRVVGQLGQYEVVWGQVSLPEAVGLLARLVNETPFQPQRDAAARLDVLGLLEAEGGRWDGVWVLGLTDDVLPAPTRPNPLLPAAVLRQAGAPRATPERELQWAGMLFDDLCRLAPHVWFSHALHAGESELRPSPFITPVGLVEQAVEPRAQDTSLVLDVLLDERGPRLAADENVSGGIALLDAQARNPLWAFVKYRLGASHLPDYAGAAGHSLRGLFMHRALELVWEQLRDHHTLETAVSGGALEPLVDRALATAADEHLPDYGEALRRLELERGRKVVLAWLGQERGRAPFSVHATEKTIVWSHDVLELVLRLDRVDRLDDGQLAIIDYKTGNGKPQPKADWLRERPVELQLPFYASVVGADATSEGVGALVLARLHARDCVLKGFAQTDQYGLAGLDVLPEWGGVLSGWRTAIEGLADEFIAGDARNVFFKIHDLEWCDVSPFLRLDESENETMKETGDADV
ncbi:MAG: PD-(D/E)XK nuclease family protein [Pusillimonas sp.]